VKNKPISLSDGTILAPASLETPDGQWDCFVDRSLDQGRTWTRSPFVPLDKETWPGEGAIQPSLIHYAPGKISMLTRSSAGYVARSDSQDNGQTWGKMYQTTLFNNNSGLDALYLENGAWVVVHNPVQKNWVYSQKHMILTNCQY
jgi:predicted neuraminidase